MVTLILFVLAISQAWAAPAPQQSSAVSSYSSGDAYPTPSVLGPETSNAATSLAASSAPTHTLVPNQQAPAKEGLFLDFSETEYPQAIRGENGGFNFSDFSRDYDRLNSDLFARPGTDAGSVPNSKWPMGLSSARSGSGGGNPGWARQQNTNEMPIAQAMAGVDMRLAPNAHRELHWHSANEWAYVFNGSARIAVVNEEGQTYVDDVEAGDLWFFPAGVPHSIQASPAGVEFLLVFSQGDFSEDATDLVSELFLRNPKEVLAKNFQTDISDFDDIPQGELYIFNAGMVPENRSYTYHLSRQEAMQVPGGSVKVVDPTVFPMARNFSAALITIEPGAMREIHWHLSSDEWNFFLSGRARLTSFSARREWDIRLPGGGCRVYPRRE
ncbi:hypothetical protein LTR99_008718 [Exophiala xenobiotica]|uniref:Cupin type-1 domain-containing protein n=1 Tax=Vermiconidia calcicola TaxID=1690605 RepID=A0AAV9Q1M6_9PEZI|nr:hypothetical protein LTR96_008988 [Exophiala xenobiotica]KAK5533362.1 hypothetical protein LTR25_007228 [Vermiconidia calcicola]KAK5542824.1 hypothetical protein LTR23_005149 [Chaetothyriales sp. CCFEE 6169]KAK5296351.1 hypothetical protein LTR99_008718 [Exophiala xenobiotica]KAK5334404.1 hypothetical protein LTR98_009358 [Exophiala xenobiotica]